MSTVSFGYLKVFRVSGTGALEAVGFIRVRVGLLRRNLVWLG